MSFFRFDHLLQFLAGLQPVVALLWIGLAIFTVAVAILMYSRWGQNRPLRKCMAMSLLAHLLLAGYSTTVEIAGYGPRSDHVFNVSFPDGGTSDDGGTNAGGYVAAKASEQPWEAFSGNTVAMPVETDLERGAADFPVEAKRLARVENAQLPGQPNLTSPSLAEPRTPEPTMPQHGRAEEHSAPAESVASIDAPAAERREAAQPAMPDVATAGERTISPPASPPVRAPSDDTPQSLVQVLSPLSRMAEDAGATDPGDAPAGSAGSRINVLRTEPFAPRVAARVTGSPSDDPAYGTAKAGTAGASSSPGGPFSTVAMASGGAAASVTNPFGVMGGGGGAKLDGAGENSDGSAVPEVYRLRTAPNRSGVVAHQGGSAETEAAVNASLKWLAANQSSEGWWDPRAHGAGKDDRVLGHSHENAGAQADTGITGLVLLSFLASGHTHQSGDYQDTVRRGLEYLMRTQARDGSLGGQAAMYEFMYCHAMATCALSEAYGMTRDKRLRRPVELAIAFTVAAQDPVGGGWRYRPGMPGDTSQLGWQLMALKSADLAGIPMSESTRQGIIRYLRSVSAGKAGGMASYRPGEQVTRTMSAEALVCWQFLGLPREHPACGETGDLLLNGLPGAGENNLYYWYYATLGMYQLQGDYWERWNDALRRTLVGRQVKDGPTAGSWDNAGDLWGGHGGRVYSTALATLTLEVYYRFLPIYSVASFGSSRPQ